MKSTDVLDPIALGKIIAQTNSNDIPVNATGTEYASQEEGFPAITMIPEEQGGEAPHGKDVNGLFRLVSSHMFNIQNGIPETFNATVSSLIGGYPKGSHLWFLSENGSYLLESSKDDNTDNFNSDQSYIGTSWVIAFPTKSYVDDAVNTLNLSKQNNITGAATSIVTNNLTANRVLISNANGKVGVSSVTSTELGYLSNARANIQTQIDAKFNSANIQVVASLPSSPDANTYYFVIG